MTIAPETHERIDARVVREDDVASAIRTFREVLLDAGFRHANGAGELVSVDDTTWLSTTYTHGEYSVYAWRRPRQRAEVGEVRYVFRVTAATDLAEVVRLGNRLKLWAKRPRKGAQWPPKGMGPVR